MSAPLLLAALLALPASAAEGGSVDLSDQLNMTCRAQGRTGACHAFASVGLLEAAIKRRHGKSVSLSSADLFARVALARNTAVVMETPDGEAFTAQIETGSPSDDLAHALAEGVAYEQTASWADFMERYEEEKAARNERCAAIADAAGNQACRRLRLIEFMRGLNGEDDAARERRLLGNSPKLAADRRETKALLAGLTLERRERGRDFDEADAATPRDRAVCREKGRKQTELMTARLNERLPLVICFGMDNLPGWDGDKSKKSGAKHCVVVRGYRTEGEGARARKSFQVRNSWGGGQTVRFDGHGIPTFEPVEITHDISEDHACAIHSASWLSP